MKRPIILPLKENKMHKYIDGLLRDGKVEDAISLIEQAWETNKAQAENKIIADLSRKMAILEKRFGIKE